LRNVNGSYIIFDNNSFDSNIGMIGGAIHINNQLQPNSRNTMKDSSPVILFKKNTFTRNLSYMEGNAVFIMGSSEGSTKDINYYVRGRVQVIFDECVFKWNSGIVSN
jgi:hypothetical protein